MTRKTEAAMLIPFNGGSRTQIAVLLTFYINASDLSFPNRVESFTSISSTSSTLVLSTPLLFLISAFYYYYGLVKLYSLKNDD